MSRVSTHFSTEELTVTSLRQYENDPNPEAMANLTLLANEQLEGVRALLGVALHITSGYRSPEVNAACGGSKTSQHMEGCAADVIPVGLDLEEAYVRILNSQIVYDQIILERPRGKGGWIHISRAAHGKHPRKQALVYEPGEDGKPHYSPYGVA